MADEKKPSTWEELIAIRTAAEKREKEKKKDKDKKDDNKEEQAAPRSNDIFTLLDAADKNIKEGLKGSILSSLENLSKVYKEVPITRVGKELKETDETVLFAVEDLIIKGALVARISGANIIPQPGQEMITINHDVARAMDKPKQVPIPAPTTPERASTPTAQMTSPLPQMNVETVKSTPPEPPVLHKPSPPAGMPEAPSMPKPSGPPKAPVLPTFEAPPSLAFSPPPENVEIVDGMDIPSIDEMSSSPAPASAPVDKTPTPAPVKVPPVTPHPVGRLKSLPKPAAATHADAVIAPVAPKPPIAAPAVPKPP
nr:hypothetical protein [Candidatus Sigynarchaeota archaeon]